MCTHKVSVPRNLRLDDFFLRLDEKCGGVRFPSRVMVGRRKTNSRLRPPLHRCNLYLILPRLPAAGGKFYGFNQLNTVEINDF